MPVIAVVNRKGGSGKSTVAAHLAAWLAHQECTVMLGDVDRQQSTRAWLRRRNAALPAIAPWTIDQKNVLRVPSGITHVVLDTPGGLHGFDLARMVMFADAILMPVCNSAFDREAAAACHAELMALPRVASGRCKLAAIGMRIDARTHAAQILGDWATELKLPFLSVLRETQLYVQCLERGMTIFDLSGQKTAADTLQWQPILNWLAPILDPTPAVTTRQVPSTTPASSPHRVGASRPDSLMPAQESLVPGGRIGGVQNNRQALASALASQVLATAQQSSLQQRQQIPAFLRQTG